MLCTEQLVLTQISLEEAVLGTFHRYRYCSKLIASQIVFSTLRSKLLKLYQSFVGTNSCTLNRERFLVAHHLHSSFRKWKVATRPRLLESYIKANWTKLP